jgi:branched-subunit amino acid transport protein
MNYSDPQIWFIVIVMGIFTFVIRFSFLGAFGRINLPPFAMRLLRYTPVAVVPGLVAPLILWPAGTGGEPDIARLTAAFVAFAMGVYFKNTLAAIFGGGVTLYLMLYLVG